jgi:hypothetical protein
MTRKRNLNSITSSNTNACMASDGYPYLPSVSTPTYNSAYAPAQEWVQQYRAEVMQGTQMEVRAGYPMPSYVHQNMAMREQLPSHFCGVARN